MYNQDLYRYTYYVEANVGCNRQRSAEENHTFMSVDPELPYPAVDGQLAGVANQLSRHMIGHLFGPAEFTSFLLQGLQRGETRMAFGTETAKNSSWKCGENHGRRYHEIGKQRVIFPDHCFVFRIGAATPWRL